MSAPAAQRRFRGVSRALLKVARYGRPQRLLLFGPMSLGDDLLCTTVLREARRRGTPFAMMTNRPELFTGSSDAAAVMPVDDYHHQLLQRLGTEVVRPYYARANPTHPAQELMPPRHIAAEMCRLAGLRGEVAARPYLHLTTEEHAAGRRLPRQIAIQSSCLAAALPSPTKEWGANRLAAVARLLQREFSLVQLGHPKDPALPVDLDLRGKTTLREAAGVLAGSLAFVGLEGFLANLARAVDCPSVIVHGGRLAEGICSYGANRNFFHSPPCSPCNLRIDCPHGLECLSAISPEAVAAAARELVVHPPTRPLFSDTVILP